MAEIQSSGQYDPKQTIIINQTEKKSNGVGTAGFVISLISLFLGWIPIIGWMMWATGLILSLIGVFKSPRGLAIAGLLISFLGIVLLLLFFAGIGAALTV